MQRRIFTEDHESFRKTIRDFIAKEVAPVYHDWEKQGHPPRESTTGWANSASWVSKRPSSSAVEVSRTSPTRW